MMSEYDTFISIILRGQEGRRGVEQAPLEDGIQETVFDVPPEHIIQSSRGRGWNGLDVAEVIHPLDDFALPAIPRHVLVINLGSPSEIKEHLVCRLLPEKKNGTKNNAKEFALLLASLGVNLGNKLSISL